MGADTVTVTGLYIYKLPGNLGLSSQWIWQQTTPPENRLQWPLRRPNDWSRKAKERHRIGVNQKNWGQLIDKVIFITLWVIQETLVSLFTVLFTNLVSSVVFQIYFSIYLLILISNLVKLKLN